MKRLNHISTMVTVAGPLLDDPSFLDTERPWVRAGNSGNLHLDKRCFLLNRGNSKHVTMTLRVAATKQICEQCFAPAFGDRVCLRALGYVEGTQGDLRTIRKRFSLITKANTSAYGELVKTIDDALGRLQWPPSELALAVQANETARGELAALRAECLQGLAAGSEAMLVELATSLIADTKSFSGYKVIAVPSIGSDQIQLYGQSGTTLDDQATIIWNAWRQARISGADARRAALDAAATSELHTVEQLETVEIDTATRGNLADVAREAWVAKVAQTTEQLTAQWEARTSALLGLAANPTVTVLEESPRQLRTEDGAMRWCVISGDGVRKGRWTLLRSNALIDKFLARFGQLDVIEGALSDELFETAKTLWDPTVNNGAYRDVRAALDAAAALCG